MLDRLTYWNEEYGCWSYKCASGDAAKRLAAYENNGISPEDVKRLAEGKAIYEAYDGSKLDKADQYIEKLEKELAEHKALKDKLPEMVCLCGSTRFKDMFNTIIEQLTLEGKIVLSVGLFGHADGKYGTVITDEVKLSLDELHKRKIDLCDRVLVLNVGGYVGDSTRSEIKYAAEIGKPIEYLEDCEFAKNGACTAALCYNGMQCSGKDENGHPQYEYIAK